MDLDRDTGVEEQRTPRTRSRLGQLLGDRLAEREPAVDELGRKVVGQADAALAELVEPEPVDVSHARVDGVERLSVEQVRCVDRVPGSAKLVGKRANAGGQ